MTELEIIHFQKILIIIDTVRIFNEKYILLPPSQACFVLEDKKFSVQAKR